MTDTNQQLKNQAELKQQNVMRIAQLPVVNLISEWEALNHDDKMAVASMRKTTLAELELSINHEKRNTGIIDLNTQLKSDRGLIGKGKLDTYGQLENVARMPMDKAFEYVMQEGDDPWKIINDQWGGDLHMFSMANPHINSFEDIKKGTTIVVPNLFTTDLTREALSFFVEGEDGELVHITDYYHEAQKHAIQHGSYGTFPIFEYGHEYYNPGMGSTTKSAKRWTKGYKWEIVNTQMIDYGKDFSYYDERSKTGFIASGDDIKDRNEYYGLKIIDSETGNPNPNVAILLSTSYNPEDMGFAIQREGPHEEHSEADRDFTYAMDNTPLYWTVPLSDEHIIIKASWDRYHQAQQEFYKKWILPYQQNQNVEVGQDMVPDKQWALTGSDSDAGYVESDESVDSAPYSEAYPPTFPDRGLYEQWESVVGMTAGVNQSFGAGGNAHPQAIAEYARMEDYFNQLVSISSDVEFNYNNYYITDTGGTPFIVQRDEEDQYSESWIKKQISDRADKEFWKDPIGNTLDYGFFKLGAGFDHMLIGFGELLKGFSENSSPTDYINVPGAGQALVKTLKHLEPEKSEDATDGVMHRVGDYLIKTVERSNEHLESTGGMSSDMIKWGSHSTVSGGGPWNDEGSWLNLAGTMAEALPNLVAIIGTTYGVTVATKNPYAGASAGMTFSIANMTGSSYRQFKESETFKNGDITLEEAWNTAMLVGFTSGLLDFSLAGRLINKMPGGKKIFTNKLTSVWLKKLKDPKWKSVFGSGTVNEAFKSGFTEMITETLQEVVAIGSEYSLLSDPIDLSDGPQAYDRLLTSGVVGMILGSGTGAVFNNMHNKMDDQQKIKAFGEIDKIFNNSSGVRVGQDGSIIIPEEILNQLPEEKREYYKSPEFKAKFNIISMAKKYPAIPLELAMIHTVQENNPHTKDVNVKVVDNTPEMIVTEEWLIEKGYNPKAFEETRLKKGVDKDYEEGKNKYVVQVHGNNEYSYPSSKGSIVLNRGASQDVYLEELTEVLYKKLEGLDPELKKKIDYWIQETGAKLEGDGLGGPRGTELFSKAFVFNHLNYNELSPELAKLLGIPQDILQGFQEIFNAQEDGSDVSLLFNQDIDQQTAEKELGISDIKLEKPTDNPVETPEPKKTYRLEPSGAKTLYHVTRQSTSDRVQEEGLKSFQTTLWVDNEGNRQGEGEIYVFESLEDAQGWAVKMELDHGENAVILEVDNVDDRWEEDPASVYYNAKGKWLRRFDGVKPENIRMSETQINHMHPNQNDVTYRLSPQKLASIEQTLNELVKEGAPAQYWYEMSGQAILDLVDGNVDDAKKILSIIAITSPQMGVKPNFGQMIKAVYKYVQGDEPLAGKYPIKMSEKIEAVMRGEEFEGLKTDNFYKNLMSQIESTGDRPVTIDMWMMRAFGFDRVPNNIRI